MGRKTKKPGKGKEKTERKTAKGEEKRARRDSRKVSEEDDIDQILVIVLSPCFSINRRKISVLFVCGKVLKTELKILKAMVQVIHAKRQKQ